jgi:hypothetical protein
MHWYVASLVMNTRFDQGPQTEYPVWENLILIQAKSSRRALDRANKLGRSAQKELAHSVMYRGRHASLTFAGVRRLVTLEDGRPTDGSQVSMTLFQVRGQKAFRRLLRGKEVSLEFF